MGQMVALPGHFYTIDDKWGCCSLTHTHARIRHLKCISIYRLPMYIFANNSKGKRVTPILFNTESMCNKSHVVDD